MSNNETTLASSNSQITEGVIAARAQERRLQTLKNRVIAASVGSLIVAGFFAAGNYLNDQDQKRQVAVTSKESENDPIKFDVDTSDETFVVKAKEGDNVAKIVKKNTKIITIGKLEEGVAEDAAVDATLANNPTSIKILNEGENVVVYKTVAVASEQE